MRRFGLRGIRDKLLVSISALIFLISLFIVFFFPARLERAALQATVAEAETIRSMTAYSLGAGLFFRDTVAVSEVLGGTMTNRDVRFAMVRDIDGGVVARSRRGQADAYERRDSVTSYFTGGGQLYVTNTSVYLNGVPVGMLTVGLSLGRLNEEVKAAQELGILIGLLTFVTGFSVVLAISNLVTRPLTALSKVVRQIAAGDLSLRADKSSDAEIVEFVGAFNNLVDRLVGTQDELSATNLDLEARVDRRTIELQRSEASLKASESMALKTGELLRSLVEVAPQAIVALSSGGTISRWNRAAESLFGWTQEELVGKPLPKALRKQFAALAEVLHLNGENSDSRSVEQLFARKDGRRVTVLVSVAVMKDETGQPLEYIAVATDMTERKSLEEQLRQLQKMEAIGRLAGGVAHDFNNLLTVIIASSHMLLDAGLRDEDREDIEAIEGAAQRGASLTRQLLLFSRQGVVQARTISLDDVLRGMQPVLLRLLRANIRLEFEQGASNGYLVADPSQLEQVILNLVVNAADAMPNGGLLRIESTEVDVPGQSDKTHEVPPGSYLMFSVLDTGIGIDSSILANLFEPFFTTKEIGKGTGLGLATTYAVISQLGGHIRVSTEAGKGSCFRIYLPRSEAQAIAETAALEEEFAAAALEVILLVEDEASVRMVMARVLSKLGYHVIEASSGEEALIAVETYQGEIRLVITDLMMPGMDGYRLSELLSSLKPGLPVIFLSGYAAPTVPKGGLVDGSRFFLQKPVNSKDLRAAIRQALAVVPG